MIEVHKNIKRKGQIVKKLKNYINKNYKKGAKYFRNILKVTWIGNVKKIKIRQV